MNILAISSSPRIGGNTDLLVDQIIRALKDNGENSEKINLAKLNMTPCTQCDFCYQAGNCCIEDDIQSIYPKIAQADWLIFASPIYFMAHCAQAKILIDRCQNFWAQKYILKKPLRSENDPPRRGVFISVGATHGPKVFEGTKITMKWFFDALDMQYYENLLIEAVDKKGDIRNHPTALRDAYNLGQKIAQLKQNP